MSAECADGKGAPSARAKTGGPMTEDDFVRVYQVARTTRDVQLARGDPPNRSIRHTRELIVALRACGYDARPFPVRAIVENAANVRFRASGSVDVVAAREAGAFDIGLGWRTEAGHEWPGHLIAEIPLHGCFVDVSLDQAHDPQHGLVIANPIVFVADAFGERAFAPDGSERYVMCVPLAEGAQVSYFPYPEEQGFRHGREWNRG
jgi:hypothetical protein